jgi:hypothetical protein
MKNPFENRALRPSLPPIDSPGALERSMNDMPSRNGQGVILKTHGESLSADGESNGRIENTIAYQ